MSLSERIRKVKDKLAALLKKRDDRGKPQAIKKGDLGPDVSSFQGSVDWDNVASQCSFAIVKATEGRTWSDPTFTKVRLDSMRGKVAIGAYHFARPANNTAASEVQHFISTVKGAGGKFISLKDWREGKEGVLPVLDFESQPFSAGWAESWRVEFEKATKVRPVVYGYGSSLTPIKDVLDGFAGVWIAGYPNWANYSGPPPFLHQFTDRGSCAGVSGPCDMNRVLS